MPFNTIRWADVSVRDWDSAKEFYTGMFNWTYDDQYYDRQVVYSLACLGKAGNSSEPAIVAALGQSMQGEKNEELKSWRSYIIVREIATTIEKLESAHGRVIIEPMNVMDAGAVSVCTDSNGVEFRLWEPARFTGPEIGDVPGTINWFELTSIDPLESKKFYNTVFGWNCEERRTATDDKYWVFSSDGKPLASMHSRLDETSGKEIWLPYFRVASVSQSLGWCRERGGSTIFGPKTEIGLGVYAIVADNERNMFGIAEYIH